MDHVPGSRSMLLRLLGMSVLVFCMVIIELQLLSKTSALTLSIAGTIKEVLTVALAEEVFHDHLSPINMLGLFLCLLGVQLYTCLKLRRPSLQHEGLAHKDYAWHANGHSRYHSG